MRRYFDVDAAIRRHWASLICPLTHEHWRNAKLFSKGFLSTALAHINDKFHAPTIAICFYTVNSKLRILTKSILLFNDTMSNAKQTRLENLRALIKEFRTAEEVARRAGTAPMYLSQIINGAKSSTGRQRGVGDALAKRLEVGCDKPEGWMDLPHGELSQVPGAVPVIVATPDNPNFYHIPKVQLILRAGFAGFETVPEIYDGSTLSVNKNWVDRKGFNPEDLVAMTVTGESMEPNLYDGDLVIVNTADRKMQDGGVFVFNYEAEAVIKRLVKERGQWWLFSDNSDQVRHRPKSCAEGECWIVGRVVRRETDRL